MVSNHEKCPLEIDPHQRIGGLVSELAPDEFISEFFCTAAKNYGFTTVKRDSPLIPVGSVVKSKGCILVFEVVRSHTILIHQVSL